MVHEVTATIVIPCYNEEARLPVETLESLVDDFPTIKFIFVDHGSTDGTLGLLRTLSRDHPHRFSVLGFESNRGKAEAVRKGVLQGLTERPVFIGYWDADLSTPLDAIPLFLDVFKNQASIEMVLGSRLKSLGRVIFRNPFRHYGGRVIAGDSALGRAPQGNGEIKAKIDSAAFFDRAFTDDECARRADILSHSSGFPGVSGFVFPRDRNRKFQAISLILPLV